MMFRVVPKEVADSLYRLREDWIHCRSIFRISDRDQLANAFEFPVLRYDNTQTQKTHFMIDCILMMTSKRTIIISFFCYISLISFINIESCRISWTRLFLTTTIILMLMDQFVIDRVINSNNKSYRSAPSSFATNLIEKMSSSLRAPNTKNRVYFWVLSTRIPFSLRCNG